MEGASSEYFGVVKEVSSGQVKYIARCAGKNLGRYAAEKDAATAYDDYALYFYGQSAKTNGFGQVGRYVPLLRQERHLPEGVRYNKTKTKYRAHVTINGERKELGTFVTVEEAQQAVVAAKEIDGPVEKDVQVEYNEHGEAIIKLKNRDHTSYALVDDGDWHDLMRRKWHVNQGGYAQGRNGSNTVTMHQYILGSSDSS